MSGLLYVIRQCCTRSGLGARIMQLCQQRLLFLTMALAVNVVSVEAAEGKIKLSKFTRLTSCSSDLARPAIKTSRVECGVTCVSHQSCCKDFTYDDVTGYCSVYAHEPLFYAAKPGCSGYKNKEYIDCFNVAALPVIPPQCCAIPFTLNGAVHYGCVDDGGGLGCFYGDRQWKLCQQPPDCEPALEATATAVLSAVATVSVPVMSVNSWIMMQNRITTVTTTVTFDQNWDAYRDGFGPAAADENYWLGLDKVYRLMQMGNVRLRVEIKRNTGAWQSAEYSTFSLTDEASEYVLFVSGYSGDAGDALRVNTYSVPAATMYPVLGMKFSTPDRENDLHPSSHCAAQRNSGWWYNYCGTSDINKNDNNILVWTDVHYLGNVRSSRMLVKLE